MSNMVKKMFYGSWLLLSCCFLQPINSFAQIATSTNIQDSTQSQISEKPIVEYINGEKHINIEQLYFSPNMTVWEFLQLFPEMVTRGSNDVLNNYSIVMDDYTLGLNRDEVLFQMTLGELKEIIITDNPSVAYAQNGVGGVIELVPRSLHDGISGNAQLDVATETCVLASANVNYQKDKLKIRSFLKGEYLNTLDKYSQQYFGATRYNKYSYQNNQLAGTELAKFSIEYAASAKDEMSFSIWETYGHKTTQIMEINDVVGLGTRYDTTSVSGISTLTRLTYQHRFNPYHKIKIGANYSFSNTVNHLSDEQSTYSQPHRLSVDLRYDGSLIHTHGHTLDIKTGVDFSSNLSKADNPSTPTNGYINVSPLLEFRYKLKDKLFVRAGGRYHFDKYKDYLSEDQASEGHDYMLSGEICYTPATGHTLRVSGARDRLCSNVRQPDGYVASADLSYIYQKQLGYHYLNFTTGFQYDYVTMTSGNLYNVYSSKVGIVWQYKILCLSLTGQLFDNEYSREEIEGYHLYYNLRLTPILTLPEHWSISANFMYNSPLMSPTITEGDYFYTSLRVSKQFGSWSINFEFSDPFHYQTTDKYYMSEAHLQNNILYGQKSYYLYHRYVNLGVMYRF